MFICKERRSPACLPKPWRRLVRRPSISMRDWNSLPNAGQQRFFSCEWARKFETGPTTVAAMRSPMKIPGMICALLGTITLSIASGTSEQEKAFTDKYKKAFEAKDTATLESFLYTQGSDPAALGFYKMMQAGEAGAKTSSLKRTANS